MTSPHPRSEAITAVDYAGRCSVPLLLAALGAKAVANGANCGAGGGVLWEWETIKWNHVCFMMMFFLMFFWDDELEPTRGIVGSN